MYNLVWNMYYDTVYSNEVTVRTYNHPEKGMLYATIVNESIASVIGPNGPVEFQEYDDGRYFSVGNFVTEVIKDNFIERGL